LAIRLTVGLAVTGSMAHRYADRGPGDDQFVYANRIHGTDQITDFSNTAGNDDAFLFKSTVFGKLPIGVITDTAFQISTDAVATTGAIRFIYDTDDRGLYFDPDGSGSQQAILMVTLQEGAILTSADILIY
jgi:Ca2+-binding RTX toxin-like protein